jgi:hypothetical protein
MLKLEIVKELRDAKNTTVESNKQTESSMDRMSESLGLVLKELRTMNKNIKKVKIAGDDAEDSKSDDDQIKEKIKTAV